MTRPDCPHGGDFYSCAPCQRADDQGHAHRPTPRSRLTIIRARMVSNCPACGSIIVPGDEIAKSDDGWCHLADLEVDP